jgi:hypothetical protein
MPSLTRELATWLPRVLGCSGGAQANYGSGPLAGVRKLWIFLALEVLVLAVFGLPHSLRFDWYAFGDQGTNLRAQVLLDQGERPMIDFGYHYGLLPLVVGRVWFWLVGRTPAAYQAAMVICQLLVTWGLARFAVATRVGPAGLALLMATMPSVVPASYVNLSHALEAVLISHSLAEQARDRRSVALALMTACLFVKPTMAYVYGLLLVIIIAYQTRFVDRSGLIGFARKLAPAAATGAALAAFLMVIYGPVPLVFTVLPVSGAKSYAASNYGFFRGIGRDFWIPKDAGPGYYLGTLVGFWFAGTACLIAAALFGALRRMRETGRERGDANEEIIVTCAVMHIAFVCAFFGNAWSWSYYFYVLIMGLMVVAGRCKIWTLWVFGLTALALLGQKAMVQSTIAQWSNMSRHADMAGLWSTPEEQSEWREARQLLRDHDATMLGPQGGAIEILFPENFAAPLDFFLNPGLALPEEVRRKADQVAAAPQVLMSHSLSKADDFLAKWPEFREALDGCEVTHDGMHFRVYQRVKRLSRPQRP